LPASRFIGLDITRDRPNHFLHINQSDFIAKMLRRYNMAYCHPSPIPANKDNRPSPMMTPKSEDDRNKMAATPVREALGSLMYLMAMSRPDIALAVNQVTAYVSNPGSGHWEAVKLIFSYLAGTGNYGIRFARWRTESSHLYKVLPTQTSLWTSLHGNQPPGSYSNFLVGQSHGEARDNVLRHYRQLMLRSMMPQRDPEKPSG
jgi:hypothetical protein